MKGIVLAGGTGTRLLPLTKVTNKHLLPVYNKPMIYFPLEILVGAGIKDILIVTGPENAGDFMKLLGSGKDFGAELSYKIQDEAGGIAQALGLAEGFIGSNGKFAVILGDNIFGKGASQGISKFEKESFKAKIFLKESEHPERFGVAEVKGGKVISIEEKPKQPKSRYCVTGLYLYDSSVFNIIKKLKPSARKELEITDVNNEYIKRGEMGYELLEGGWSDAGTMESLHNAATLAKKESQRL
ncbi:MAG: sugar phosphate nucleotidyltransferase [Candidatus Micrarchaeota archaeon]